MDRIILVTGAAGHLGNVLVKRLLNKGEQVRGLVRSMPGKEVYEGYDVELYEGDVCKYESLEAAFIVPEGIDLIVVHAAGIVSTTSEDSEKVRQVNVEGTRNIIDRCINHGVKRMIYTSSVHAIPEEGKDLIEEVRSFDPEKVKGVYAKTKAEASQLVLDSQKKGLKYVMIHPSGIIGPEDYRCGHTTQLILDYLRGRLWATVEGGYDFVDVRDVADGIISAIDRAREGESYIFSGHYVSVKEFISLLSKLSGKADILHRIPMVLAKLTAPISELYYKLRKQKPLYSSYSLYTLTSNSNFSNKKACEELGFRPREIEESIKDTLSWISKGKYFEIPLYK